MKCRLVLTLLAAALLTRGITTSGAGALACDLGQYQPAPGLTAQVEQNLLVVSWTGQAGTELRARYAIDAGQPVVRDLSIRKAGAPWAALGRDLVPE